MNELTLHPNVYATGASTGLISLLERAWVRETRPGDGSFYIISGFANYNGGVRFFETFRQHVANGGQVLSVFSGSTGARLTSRQVVLELLSCGAKVFVINRKRLLHAKCYGTQNSKGELIIVTSGNFTGPGMSQNVEMAVCLEPDTTKEMGFSWDAMMERVLAQKWDFYEPDLANMEDPAWQLLYDEQASNITLDESDEVTLVLRLSHSDTARINAAPGSSASKGTQYFWLSKDCYNFFPPLTIRNKRGQKTTYSCLIELTYLDLGITERTRVTFEAENNLDFRLGTAALRGTRIASEGDIVTITRAGEDKFQLRVFRQGSARFDVMMPYAVHFIGHQGKKYGFLPNGIFEKLLGK